MSNTNDAVQPRIMLDHRVYIGLAQVATLVVATWYVSNVLHSIDRRIESVSVRVQAVEDKFESLGDGRWTTFHEEISEKMRESSNPEYTPVDTGEVVRRYWEFRTIRP